MKIVEYPHPALRWEAKPLTAIDAKVHRAAAEMLELMYAHKGLGLAATQVALPYQMLVLNPTGDPAQREHEGVYLNPVILERKGTQEGEEGCLSFPELFQKVRRAKVVKVQAYNLQGQALEITASDLPARLWQHEVDHLHGVLFIDKMGPIGKLASRALLKTFEAAFRKAREKGEIPSDEELARMRQQLEDQA